MSERVQLLLSDRILGMTLVPEGRVWNYGIGLTQLWSPNLPYAMTLDTPLLFWAEEHRPAAFLTVSTFMLVSIRQVLTFSSFSSLISSKERTAQTLKIALLDSVVIYLSYVVLIIGTFIFLCNCIEQTVYLKRYNRSVSISTCNKKALRQQMGKNPPVLD